MAAAAEPLLMTVAELHELPSREDVLLKLHWGQIVELTQPKVRHSRLRHRLMLPGSKAEELGVLLLELPFRALPPEPSSSGSSTPNARS